MIKDEPYNYSDGTPVRTRTVDTTEMLPYAKRSYIPYNIPAVKVLTEITPETGYDYLTKFGFSKLLRQEERAISPSLSAV